MAWSLFGGSGNQQQNNNQQPGQQGQQGNQQNNQNNNQQQNHNQQNQPGGGGGATLPNNGSQGNNNQGNGNNQNSQNNQQPNPLDTYSKMFDNPNTEGDKAPAFTIDPKVMDSVVSSQDFTQGIDPEVMQKAMSGDAQSMIQLIQNVGRNSYRAAIEHGGMLTDKFVGASLAHNGKSLGNKVRQELTTNALSSTPNFQHPVVKKQLTEIAQRLQQANPDATPQEIADAAKQYLTDLATALNPQDPKQQSQNKSSQEERGAEFWDDYFSK